MGHLGWIFLALFIMGIITVPIIFFLLTLQRTLIAISPQNRRIDPNMVWLCLIPIFNLGWNFYILDKLSTSIQAELRLAGTNTHERPAYSIGLAYCIMRCCIIIPIFFYPGVGAFYVMVWLAIAILGILYWVKVADFKTRIEQQPPHQNTPAGPPPYTTAEANVFGQY